MNLAEQAVAAMATPVSKPIPRLVVNAVERTAGSRARIAIGALDSVYGALMLLRADIRDEATAHQIEALIPSLQEIAKRYSAQVEVQRSPHPVGRFAPDDMGRGGE